MIGKKVVLEHRLPVGTDTVIGRIIAPIWMDEMDQSVVKFISIKGTIATRKIEGLPLPIEIDEPMTLHLVPVEDSNFSKLTILE